MKIALGIEYQGSAYHGWQRQQKLNTIQAELECALSKVANHQIRLFCAGRTDAGVHAFGQVVHFCTDSIRNLQAWVKGGNSYLPNDIVVNWACQVPEDFSARFSAIERHYRYLILNRPTSSAIYRNLFTWFSYKLNVDKMHEAAQNLVGKYDFSSFRSSSCQSKSPIRELRKLTVVRYNNVIQIDIVANAFLHHMVRNIVGVLFMVGNGKRPQEWVNQVLVARDRGAAAATASPHGLYLMRVNYTEHFCIPAVMQELPIFEI